MLSPEQLSHFLDNFLSQQDSDFDLSKAPTRPHEPNLRVYDFFKPESPVISDRELSERLQFFEIQVFQYKALYLAWQVDIERWKTSENTFLLGFKNQLLLANSFETNHEWANKIFSHCFYSHEYDDLYISPYGFLYAIAEDFIYIMGSLQGYSVKL